VTGFYPTYKMTDRGSTHADTLVRAGEIGMEAGLRYDYAGNRPGHTVNWEHTRCPFRQTAPIRRQGVHGLGHRTPPRGPCTGVRHGDRGYMVVIALRRSGPPATLRCIQAYLL